MPLQAIQICYKALNGMRAFRSEDFRKLEFRLHWLSKRILFSADRVMTCIGDKSKNDLIPQHTLQVQFHQAE